MTPPTLWSLVFLSVFSTLVWAQGPVQTFFPASIPLAIRSPYLSIWMPSTSNSGPISNSWPYFWGQAVRSHLCAVRNMHWSSRVAVHHRLGRKDQGGRADIRLDGERRVAERAGKCYERPGYPHTIHLRNAGRPNEHHHYLSFSHRGERRPRVFGDAQLHASPALSSLHDSPTTGSSSRSPSRTCLSRPRLSTARRTMCKSTRILAQVTSASRFFDFVVSDEHSFRAKSCYPGTGRAPSSGPHRAQAAVSSTQLNCRTPPRTERSPTKHRMARGITL